MVGYRNAVYNYKDQVVEIHTWDKKGERIVTSVPCLPYFYYEDITGEATSIFNTCLRKKEFNNYFDKTKYLKERGLKQVFDNYSPVQQTLIDTYWKYNDTEDFAKFALKIFFLDIEAVGKGAFSTPEDASVEINVITIYDSSTKKYKVWGNQQYSSKEEDVDYYFCTTEEELLTRFINYIRENSPDILSGWNSDRYDVPYIINRIVKLLGEQEADSLSPYGRRYTKAFAGKFGKKEIVHRLDGISCVDYMDIYKKFCPVNRESYKLDYIGQVELDQTKLDYGDQSLYEFMINDWETFVDYNIQDVRLLVRLEEQLKYVELLRMLSYMGCTTFESALGTVSLVTGATAVEARKRNQRLATCLVDEDQRDFEGGHVSVPLIGHHSSIVSFDANSLYPNTMITLNASPETKVGRIINVDKDKISIRNVDGIVLDMTKSEFKDFVLKEKIVISKAKILFTQKKKGIMADMVDTFYKKRVKTRSEIKKIKKKKELTEAEKIKITQLETKQQSIKLYINSVYGVFSNKYCPIQDIDIAESITLTGQAVAKEAREIFKKYVTQETGITDPIELEKGLVYGDTDSIYLSLFQLVTKFSIDGKLTEETYKVAEKLEKFINDEIKLWAIKTLNTSDCRFEFKRETLCDYGVFLEKKRYVLHVLDKEGFAPEDPWKYTGVEVVSTKMPKSVKPYVKNIIETLILTKSESETNKIFSEAYDKFLSMSVEDISQVSGIRNLEKYEVQCDGFSTCKGMPWHVKAAYHYNLLIEELGISNKYEKISSGDKMKLFYVDTPNKYGIKVIAFKNRYPVEFHEIFKPNMFEMFEKDMYKCIERFYKVMNWVIRKPTEQLMCTLDELLS
jgi:DNA polymerase elongation subunit (family B)